MSVKKILLTVCFIFLPVYYSSAAESENSICAFFVTKMMRGSEHRVTLEYLNDGTGKRELLGPHLSFILPPTTPAFNFIKLAYLYNKRLCVKYISQTNGEIITNTVIYIHDNSQ